MPETLTLPPLTERFRPVHSRPAERTLVRAVVTEMVAVLEPVDRDPFLDDADDVPRAWLTPPLP
jgi:hypothetical protein